MHWQARRGLARRLRASTSVQPWMTGERDEGPPDGSSLRLRRPWHPASGYAFAARWDRPGQRLPVVDRCDRRPGTRRCWFGPARAITAHRHWFVVSPGTQNRREWAIRWLACGLAAGRSSRASRWGEGTRYLRDVTRSTWPLTLTCRAILSVLRSGGGLR
jgi:hypothetical protein